MKKQLNLKHITLIVITCLCALLILSTLNNEKATNVEIADYPVIKQRGTIKIVSEYNKAEFYIAEDSIAGIHYELAKAFANAMHLKAEIIPVMSFEDRVSSLLEGKFDIIASSIQYNNSIKDSILLTQPILQSKLVLVQRKMTSQNDSSFINSQLQLAGRTLSVVKGSPAILRIHNLSDEIGDTIFIDEIDKYGEEQLISLVAHGDIPYTICDAKVIEAVADSFPQLDYSTPISFTQLYAWAVNPAAPILADTINNWLSAFKQTANYKRILKKYYAN